jgi:hypothetical protein
MSLIVHYFRGNTKREQYMILCIWCVYMYVCVCVCVCERERERERERDRERNYSINTCYVLSIHLLPLIFYFCSHFTKKKKLNNLYKVSPQIRTNTWRSRCLTSGSKFWDLFLCKSSGYKIRQPNKGVYI